MALRDLLDKFRKGLAKTAKLLDFRSWFGRKVDQSVLDELEAKLIAADVGIKATTQIIERVQAAYAGREVDAELIDFLKNELKSLLVDSRAAALAQAPKPPTVILVAGVNGAGKTTTIAKLAHRFKRDKKSVLLAACDTFRAAAADQLEIWSGRADVDIVRGSQGADPASVAHDAADRALARAVDILIVDTAGRLHTQTHLMRELEKIRAVVARKIPGAPHEVLLVIDATNGQNAVRQAELFTKSIGCTGIVLTKLDGTAKGGVAIAVRQIMDLPVKFVGMGEGIDDLEPFDPDAYVESLLA
jgi:fused signal recognition particle receptor